MALASSLYFEVSLESTADEGAGIMLRFPWESRPPPGLPESGRGFEG